MVISTVVPITMNVMEKMVETLATLKMHHASTITVHTHVNVITDTLTQTQVYKLVSIVSSLLIAVSTMVVAPMAVKFQMVVHVMKFAGQLTIL